jgi:hypothetical protein
MYRAVQILAEHGIGCPRVAVETGTYLGNGIRNAIGSFDQIHSIEIKVEFAENAAREFADNTSVFVYCGDSAEKLSELAASIRVPVLWYLDAHYSGGPTAFGDPEDGGWPVLRELAAISSRRQPDVVIIDDVRFLGKAQWGGTEGSLKYPRTFFDFRHITLEGILAAYGRSSRQVFVMKCGFRRSRPGIPR